MRYHHVQRGRIHYILLLMGGALLVGGLLGVMSGLDVAPVLLLGGTIFIVLTFTFAQLEIEDRGDHLHVQFGPLALFRKTIPYPSIVSVSRARSSLIDGIGIHWVPGRGWIWNIAMGDCVVLELNRSTLRIGTDDATALCAFIEERTMSRATGPR